MTEKIGFGILPAMAFGTLLSALDEMGIKPPLIARQTARKLTPVMAEFAKQLHGNSPSQSMEDFMKNWKQSLKSSGFADPEKSSIELLDNGLCIKVADCLYLNMANFSKSFGYETCPVCILGVFVTSTLTGKGLDDITDIKAKKTDNLCTVKILTE
ncbi:MAG: hypothetical protein ACTSSA_10040 [Candidatus Freyarchaeota archaeon]